MLRFGEMRDTLARWMAVALLCGAASCERSSDPARRVGVGSQSASTGEAPPSTQQTVRADKSTSPSPASKSSSLAPASDGRAALRPRCVMPPRPVVAAASPASVCPEDPQGRFDLELVEVTFVDAPGRPRVLVEHAQQHAERSRGLMYRTEMPEDGGMLFTWQDDAPRSFWMKNTCLPLDMLFIDSQGFIVDLLEEVPTLNTLPRRSGCPAQRVLEVHAGWTRAHAVAPGQRVEIR